jgi:DNA-binding response OmpR family regulator
MKIIIIDQSLLLVLEGSNTIFKRSGITFISAWSTEEVLNLHGVKRADLIITDAALPLMGGAKLCSLIRSDTELKPVSIILVCGESEISLSECRKAGANAVIRKPVDPGELLWKASELLVVPQRKDMRALLRVSIKGLEGDTPFFAQSQNISISGMLLETDHVLKLDERMICTFNIGHSEIKVSCMVKRVEETMSARHRYGVKFIDCDTKSLVIIEHFVKTQPSK